MNAFRLLRDYFVWHYSTALSDILHIWWNYLWFVNHLFSVPDVLRTWFAPWKRLQEKKVNIIISPEDFFANIFVNLIMRMVGFVVRTALLGVALLCFLVIFIGGLSFLALWIFLPVLIVHFFVNGLRLLAV